MIGLAHLKASSVGDPSVEFHCWANELSTVSSIEVTHIEASITGTSIS